jgi:hypothetical protein
VWQLVGKPPGWNEGEPPHDQNIAGVLRQRGTPTICQGSGIFDFFLPFMCILGQIIDLHHLLNNPHFGNSSSEPIRDHYMHTVNQQLMKLGNSIRNLETPPQQPRAEIPGFRIDDQDPTIYRYRQTLSGYARFLLHTMSAMLGTEWDMPTMLLDNDNYLSSQLHSNALNHSVAAADALRDIISFDPDLSFKPKIMGVFIFLGSTYPYATASRFKQQTSASVVAACETYVRTHEISITTFYSEYQVRDLLMQDKIH